MRANEEKPTTPPTGTTPAKAPVSREEQLDALGPQYSKDSPFAKRMRLHQSWYRANELGVRCGTGPHSTSTSHYGNMLTDADAKAGRNFISPAALAYARLKVAEKATNRYLTIDEYRLYSNMLSSQPMCFNLFADLWLGVAASWPNSSEVLAAMFVGSDIAQVISVEVEMIPRPTGDYIGDRTAFDALVRFQGKDGKPGIVAIEMKYTDTLGDNVARDPKQQFQFAADVGLLTPEGREYYQRRKGFDQVARNLLLTLSYAHKHNMGNAINYVLGPEQDTQTPDIIRNLQSRLTPKYQDRIVWLPLQTAVDQGRDKANAYHTDHLMRFHQRYLDLGQSQHLVADPRSGHSESAMQA